MEKENTIELIHRYLLNDLSGDEKVTFEDKMASDDTIKKKVEMEKRFLNMIDLAADTELKSTISSVHKGLKNQGFFDQQNEHEANIVDMNKRRKASRMLYALAAVFALVIAAWFVFSKVSVDTQGIYTSNYKPEKILIENYMLPSAGVVEANFRLGLDQYSRGEYQKAKNLLFDFVTENPDHVPAQFYLALSEIELNNFTDAIKLLIPLVEKESDVRYGAQWYLGLSYLKSDMTSEAKTIFEQLANSGDENFGKKATEILKAWKR